MVPPTPGFMQQRTAGAYPFGGTTMAQQQQQHQTQQQQQHQQHSLQQQLGQQQQQQGAIGTTGSGSLPPHLQGMAGAPGLGNAQSGSSTSEAALDPNDFPALGSTSGTGSGGTGANSTSSPVTTLASSYASQAGTGLTPASVSSGSQGGGSASQARDFTADDFPALGGQSQSNATQGTNSSAAQDASHPPGLNGLSSQGDQHRQNMLGALQGTGQHPTPGVLNLSAQQRGMQQQPSEADKRVSAFR